MMDELIGVRVPRAVIERLDALAAATARRRSEVVRFLLARACREVLPSTWFETETIAAQRLTTGQSDRGTAAQV